MSEAGDPHVGQDDAVDVPWRLREQEPTNLIAYWPHDHPPAMTDVLPALGEHSDQAIPILDEPEVRDGAMLWCAVVDLAPLAAPVALWAERARPDPGLPIAAACRWVVGLETLLDPNDPLAEFTLIMRHLADGLTATPAILDVNTTRCYPRHELERVFGDGPGPPEDVLWIMQAVRSAPTADPDGPCVWLHTHGLWRCGLPELEMLEVPAAYAEPAAELLNHIGALFLEEPPPPPGVSIAVGSDMHVTLQPWQAIVPSLAESTPGGAADRAADGENAHVGVRAVVCDARRADHSGTPFVWPLEATTRYMRDEAGIYMTTRATQRQASRAQAAWAHFVGAFAAARVAPGRGASMVFAVKAGFRGDEAGHGREHLWFEAERIEGDRVGAVLLNQPLQVRHLRKGELAWLEPEQISDWRVETPQGCFRPGDVHALDAAVQVLQREAVSR